MSMVGTPYYMAPEMISGERYGASIDFWSFGVSVYECFCWEVPFDGRSPEAVFQKIKWSEIDWKKLPPGCREDSSFEGRDKGIAGCSPDPEQPLKHLRHLIDGLLNRDRKLRLGNNGAREIRQHAFFQGIRWDLLSTSTPPVPPEVNLDSNDRGQTPSDVAKFRAVLGSAAVVSLAHTAETSSSRDHTKDTRDIMHVPSSRHRDQAPPRADPFDEPEPSSSSEARPDPAVFPHNGSRLATSEPPATTPGNLENLATTASTATGSPTTRSVTSIEREQNAAATERATDSLEVVALSRGPANVTATSGDIVVVHGPYPAPTPTADDAVVVAPGRAVVAVAPRQAYLQSLDQNQDGDEGKAANMSSWEIAISERMTHVHKRLLNKLGGNGN